MQDRALQELQNTLKQTLQEKGVLQEVKAKIRREVFNSIQEKENKEQKILNNQQIIINEIIREYLIEQGLFHTLSVFIVESGQPENQAFTRNQISQQINIVETNNSKELPLIYGLTFGKKSLIQDKK